MHALSPRIPHSCIPSFIHARTHSVIPVRTHSRTRVRTSSLLLHAWICSCVHACGRPLTHPSQERTARSPGFPLHAGPHSRTPACARAPSPTHALPGASAHARLDSSAEAPSLRLPCDPLTRPCVRPCSTLSFATPEFSKLERAAVPAGRFPSVASPAQPAGLGPRPPGHCKH